MAYSELNKQTVPRIRFPSVVIAHGPAANRQRCLVSRATGHQLQKSPEGRSPSCEVKDAYWLLICRQTETDLKRLNNQYLIFGSCLTLVSVRFDSIELYSLMTSLCVLVVVEISNLIFRRN